MRQDTLKSTDDTSPRRGHRPRNDLDTQVRSACGRSRRQRRSPPWAKEHGTVA